MAELPAFLFLFIFCIVAVLRDPDEDQGSLVPGSLQTISAPKSLQSSLHPYLRSTEKPKAGRVPSCAPVAWAKTEPEQTRREFGQNFSAQRIACKCPREGCTAMTATSTSRSGREKRSRETFVYTGVSGEPLPGY